MDGPLEGDSRKENGRMPGFGVCAVRTVVSDLDAYDNYPCIQTMLQVITATVRPARSNGTAILASRFGQSKLTHD
ncbi:hypothetical protein ARMSODRAFT_1021103 [Armillaria solidipes]|uniref:Uncharacterized protein n=1 Tax=Armillaria solidipes TaxID=1076256 RepID=A0A2H3BUD6_9AGAR|nr:hypothetical protein ARMSODRAFT_1021103 [Armillaria solidipes]